MTRQLFQRGFTMVELVVAITISAIIVVFISVFLWAPVEAFDQQSRRNAMVGDASAAWPRIEKDLRVALPNSVRVLQNGNYFALEMIPVAGVTRYRAGAVVNSASIDVAGTGSGVITLQPANQAVSVSYYLARNPDAAVYTLGRSMTTARKNLTWTTNVANGTGTISVLPSPAAFTSPDSPRRRLYLVDAPVTYLCDRTLGTLRRYTNYVIAANQASRSTPAGLAGATSNELIARGLTACNFAQSGASATQPQTVSVRLTTTRNGDTIVLQHQSRAEFLP